MYVQGSAEEPLYRGRHWAVLYGEVPPNSVVQTEFLLERCPLLRGSTVVLYK